MSSENIFSALSKYSSGMDEDYLTEAFVLLVNFLLDRDRPIGVEILAHLCVQKNEFYFDVDESISVSTQETTEQGTPDIKVSSPDKLIYIEVKDYSPVDPNQLKRYKKELESSSVTYKKLMLLTRFPVDFSEHKGLPDRHVRWFEVYNWLVAAKGKAENPVSVYLIDEFKSFLEVKHMSIQKVGWEYINGIHALNNLVSMIESAIQSASIKIDWKAAGWNFKGFTLGNREFWCGMHFSNPLVVTFQMRKKKKFNPKLIKKPTYEMRESKERRWFRLSLEDIHFFSLDKDQQLEEVTKFVKVAYTDAQRMRIKEK